MTKPLISPDIIDTLAATMTAIVGDTAQIFAGARAAEPMLGADSVRDFVGRVLEHFVARLGGARLVASRTPVADAAMAEAMLRGIACWPVERARAAEAWQLALNLFLLDTAPQVRGIARPSSLAPERTGG